MKIEINSPCRADIVDYTMDEITSLKNEGLFKNTSTEFLLRKHMNNQWFKRSNPEGWEYNLNKLKSELYSNTLMQDSRGYWIRPGYIPYIKTIHILQTVNNVIYPKFKPLPWLKKPEFEPYDYQESSVEELINIRHGSVELATGCGKSLILLMLVQKMGLDCIILTPSKGIFVEILEMFETHLGKKYVGQFGDGKKDLTKKITIAINKSVSLVKEGTPEYDFLSKKQLMIVDEAHQFSSDSLETACHGVLNDIPYRHFLSATLFRNDGTQKLLNSIVGKIVHNINIGKAIDGGYLCPLKFTIIETFSPSTKNVTDPLEVKRVHFLYNSNIAKIAAKIANSSWKFKQESTLILIEELCQIAEIIKHLDVPYGYVHSGSKADAAVWGLEKVDLKEQLDRFNRGEIKVIIGSRAIATGCNLYPTHNTINCAGGSSFVVTCQGAMGRSTRKLENSKFKQYHKPKPFTRIFDFNVKGNRILERHLDERISFYEEANGEINHVKIDV